MIPVMDVLRQYKALKEEIDEAVIGVLGSGQYILGEEVDTFEKNFANYCGVKYAVGVGNGSDALVIALRACGIKNGDEVITTDFSFSATAEAITSVGAVPVFVDCDLDTFTISVEEIENRITSKTKAIIPVHLYGQCANMELIADIAHKNKLRVIEDCAQAAGADYMGKKAGTMGDIGCVSFFPTKNLGCAGDGGIIITNNESLYRQCRALRSHGSGIDGLYSYKLQYNLDYSEEIMDFNGNLPKYYNFIEGYNSRLDAIQASILNVKLPYLDEWNKRRKAIAGRYDKEINNNLIKKPVIASGNNHIYYVYTVIVDKRDEFRDYLLKNGISSGVYYPVPFHLQKVYEKLKYSKGDYPNAEFAANHSMVLPMFPELTENEIEHIIDTVNKWKQ